MSPLWKYDLIMERKTIQKDPSPKYDHNLSFAQGLDFSQRKHPPSLGSLFVPIKGISLFISKDEKVPASMTVEAAIVLPLFLFFFLNLMSAIEMIRLHGNLQLGLWETGNRMTVYGSILADEEAAENIQKVSAEDKAQDVSKEKDSLWKGLAGVAWSYTYVKSQLVAYLGEDYLEQSPLTRGVDGLQFVESNVFESEDCFEVVLTYSVSPVCSISGFNPFRMANRYYGHLWNGYELPESSEVFVYVTENGEVYHTNRECTHLTLSVRQVTWQQACAERNAQGGKYVACEKCHPQEGTGTVYITDEGECYHAVSTCSGLKRTVACISLSEAGELRPCQRCSKGN